MKRNEFLNSPRDTLLSDYRNAEAAPHTKGNAARIRILKSVLRQRDMAGAVLTHVNKLDERRREYILQLRTETVALLTAGESADAGERRRLDHLTQVCKNRGLWPDIQEQAAEQMRAEALTILTDKEGEKGECTARLGVLRKKLEEGGMWDAVQAEAHGVLKEREYRQREAERREQEEAQRRQREAEAEKRRLASRPTLEIPASGEITMSGLQSAICNVRMDTYTAGRALEQMGGSFAGIGRHLKGYFPSYRPGPTLRELCGSNGVSVPQFVATLNASKQSPFLLRIQGAEQGGHGGRESAERRTTIRVGQTMETATVGDLRNAAADAAQEFEPFCRNMRTGQTLAVREFWSQVTDSFSSTSLARIARTEGITLQTIVDAVNGQANGGFQLTFAGGSAQGRGGTETQRARRTIRFLYSREATVGDLRQAIEESGASVDDVCQAISALHDDFEELEYDIAHTQPTVEVWDMCDWSGLGWGDVVAQVNGAPDCPFTIDGSAREDEEKDERGDEDGEAVDRKTRILLSSKNMGGREIVEAVEAAGMSFGTFFAALLAVDTLIPEANDLASCLDGARHEGRLEQSDQAILMRYAATIKALNRCPAFPFTLECVLHDNETLAQQRLTQEQTAYLSGVKDSEGGKKDTRKYNPPGRLQGENIVQAYQSGWMGRERGNYFPEEATPGGAEDGKDVLPSIEIDPTATMRELIAAFPNGVQGLRSQMDRAGLSFSLIDTACDPSNRNTLIAEVFPPSVFHEAWFRSNLGVRFRQEGYENPDGAAMR